MSAWGSSRCDKLNCLKSSILSTRPKQNKASSWGSVSNLEWPICWLASWLSLDMTAIVERTKVHCWCNSRHKASTKQPLPLERTKLPTWTLGATAVKDSTAMALRNTQSPWLVPELWSNSWFALCNMQHRKGIIANIRKLKELNDCHDVK